MIDLGQSEEFLSSLSNVSHLHFQIWDADEGLVFSSGPDDSTEPALEELQDFSLHIINSAAFQHIPLESGEGLFGVPLRNGQAVAGSLIAFGSNSLQKPLPETSAAPQPGRTEEMERFLNQVAEFVEDRLIIQQEMEQMAEELTDNFEQLCFYSKIASRVKSITFSGTMLRELVEELLDTMRTDMAFAKLPERPEYNALVCTQKIPEKIRDHDEFIDLLVDSIPLNSPSLEEDYFIVNDSSATPGFSDLAPTPYRFLAVKMQHNGNFYGWMGLVSFNLKEIFRRSELRLLDSMAEQIAVVITNSDLYRDLERFVINMVKSLVFAIEAKDDYTRGHSERVCRYSLLMAEKLGLDEERKKILQWSSILHDSGKIGIPESILNKPWRLKDEEYQIIKNHPMKGHTILEPLEQLASSLPGMLHHHERYDGKGYPHGLKGKKIPLEARIIAVADTFDAITSSRAYRPAKTPEEALKEIEKVAGTQLDPDLVEVFKEVFTEDLAPEQGCSIAEQS
ncbi:MAG: HD-GYP domain-containing protein [Syntrophobacterales bacterium]|jgi:HD-GYP domain-containing protein (c-di-GMP phosphodiesterase class II)